MTGDKPANNDHILQYYLLSITKLSTGLCFMFSLFKITNWYGYTPIGHNIITTDRCYTDV